MRFDKLVCPDMKLEDAFEIAKLVSKMSPGELNTERELILCAALLVFANYFAEEENKKRAGKV